MSYIIHITATAERDILRATDYIEFTLSITAGGFLSHHQE